jgi:hypothetical protein
LQRADGLTFVDFLTGKDFEREDATADERVDVHHVSGIGHDARRENELTGDLTAMHGGGFDDLLLGRRGLRGRVVAIAGGERWKQGGGYQEREGLPFHGTISVAAAKLSW